MVVIDYVFQSDPPPPNVSFHVTDRPESFVPHIYPLSESYLEKQTRKTLDPTRQSQRRISL